MKFLFAIWKTGTIVHQLRRECAGFVEKGYDKQAAVTIG